MSLLSVILLLVFTACDLDNLIPLEPKEADPIPCTSIAAPNVNPFTLCEDCTAEISDELRIRVTVDDTTYVFKTSERVLKYEDTPEHATIQVDDFSSVKVFLIGTGEGMESAYLSYQCGLGDGVDISIPYNKGVEAPEDSNELCQITFSYVENSDSFDNVDNVCSSLVVYARAYNGEDEPMAIKIRLE